MNTKIFLADDSITIQKVVELTFSDGGYDVVCVGNGAQAIQRVAEVSPDIALIDVVMPERDGYDVCAHIRRTAGMEWVPVLLMTGTFEPYDEARARQAGASGHMTKPFESRALQARVNELLARHPRPGVAPRQTAPAAAATQTQTAQPAQTLRMKTTEIFQQVPPGPAPQRPVAAAPPPSPPAEPPRVATAADAAIDRAVRDALSGISEKIVREVAWEVIPDLAEAIIKRRIRELEEEAEARG